MKLEEKEEGNREASKRNKEERRDGVELWGDTEAAPEP